MSDLVYLIDNNDDLETIFNEYLAMISNYDGRSVKCNDALVESVKAAQERIGTLAAMSAEDIEKTAQEYNETLSQGLTLKESNRNIRINQLISQVKSISVDTEEAQDVLNGLIESLWALSVPNTSGVLPELTPEEWYAQAVTTASEHHQRKVAQLQEEMKKVEELNAAIRLIKEYFKNK